MHDILLNRREVIASIAATAAAGPALPRVLGAAPGSTFNFLVVGDWGRNGDHISAKSPCRWAGGGEPREPVRHFRG